MMASAMLKKGDVVPGVGGRHNGPLMVPLPACWYVLQLHPNCEAKVMRTFARWNISAYLPMINKQVVSTRSIHGSSWTYEVKRQVSVPLFPGLVFVPDFECDASDRITRTDGVAGFLRFGPSFATINSERSARAPGVLSMRDVRNIVAIANTVPSKRERAYATGQIVRITDGPFASFSGRIERLDSKGRLSVLINLFGRLSPTSMSEEQIEPISQSRGRGSPA